MNIIKNSSFLKVSGKMDITIVFSACFTYCSTGQNYFSACFENDFFGIRIIKLYVLDVLKAWDYAQTIFRSEKLQIAYPKAEIGTTKYRKSFE